jgi:hypothetical protein
LLLTATAAAAEQAQLSKKNVKALIAGATTPEDYRKLAGHYRDQAQRPKEMQKEHNRDGSGIRKELVELFDQISDARKVPPRPCGQLRPL